MNFVHAKPMHIRLRQLEAFVATVDAGSVTGAAKDLNLTQSSASKLLTGLEETVAFPLFDRVGRQMRLTDQGRVFLVQARKTLQSFEDIQRVGSDLHKNLGRRLRIAAIVPLTSDTLTPKAISDFLAVYPEYAISIQTKSRISIDEWIASGQSDIGFTLLPCSHAGLATLAMKPVNAVAIIPAGHALAGKDYLEPADLQSERIIMPHSTARVRALVDGQFASAGYRLVPQIETSSAIAAGQLVSHGVGVSVLDPFSCQSIPQDKVHVLPWRPETPMTYGMIWSNARKLTQAEQRFFDLMAKMVADYSTEPLAIG